MSNKAEAFGLAVAAVTIGTLYIFWHEHRRRAKKAEKARLEEPIRKELLLKILNKSAEASKAVIEKVRCHKMFVCPTRRCKPPAAASLNYCCLQYHALVHLDALDTNSHNYFMC